MKIGLIRHFKVNHPFPEKKLLSKSEVVKWFAEYDNTEDIAYKQVDLSGIQWERCYASPMIRAISTANHIYKGDIVQAPALKELNILHRFSDRLKLPFMVWAIVIRIQSFFSNSDTVEFRRRIVDYLDNTVFKKGEDVLIVSHWFVMRIIRKELLKRGLKGSKFRSDDYGTLYIYERSH